MLLGHRLAELRNNKELTLKECAKNLGLNITTLSNYETGYREPSLETLTKIADFFNVSTDYLLGRTDIITPPPGVHAIGAEVYTDKMEGKSKEEIEEAWTKLDKLIKKYIK